MSKSKDEIINEIREHISDRGGDYSNWYVGRETCSNARQQLFSAHHVRQKGDCWIHRRADSSTTAREIESYFIAHLHTDGKNEAGEAADTIYAYRKAPHTTP